MRQHVTWYVGRRWEWPTLWVKMYAIGLESILQMYAIGLEWIVHFHFPSLHITIYSQHHHTAVCRAVVKFEWGNTRILQEEDNRLNTTMITHSAASGEPVSVTVSTHAHHSSFLTRTIQDMHGHREKSNCTKNKHKPTMTSIEYLHIQIQKTALMMSRKIKFPV